MSQDRKPTRFQTVLDAGRYESQFRYQFATVESMRSHIAAAGPESVMEVLDKCVPRSDFRERTKLRLALEVLGGHSEAPAARASPAAAASGGQQPLDGAATAHQKPGAVPIGVGKKVILVNLTTETDLNGKVGEVMPPHFDDAEANGQYTVKLMHGVTGQAVTYPARICTGVFCTGLHRRLTGVFGSLCGQGPRAEQRGHAAARAARQARAPPRPDREGPAGGGGECDRP
eukprot:867737-Prymnesium_polylepis.2